MRAAVLGPSGRMGSALVALAKEVELVGLIDAAGSPLIGNSVAGVTVTSDLEAGLARAQVYIDFTTPAATAAAARVAARLGVAAVVGTTGLTADSNAALDDLAKRAGVLWAPNFSLGVNVLFGLAERAAAALGEGYDLKVFDLHHRKKVDAPSGTAIAIAEALAKGRGLPDRKSIDIASLRGGDVVGDHTAYLLSDMEQLELTHRANSRNVFAQGAWHAARWLVGKPPGRYTMRDVLGV